ncbi:MAG: DUF1638 domain-containing protein, partial [Gammaproteobacteria bacterium]|nr:DUF1638 domain-containing protein [Gammaproteobacteria bacterium]
MSDRCLIIACGALAREIIQLKSSNHWSHLDVECLSASLHNRPQEIPARLAEKLEAARGKYDRILVGYADCGTAGKIDELIARENNVSRLSGPHCFSSFAGADRYEAMMEDEPGTFWLTDFLARHFETMVLKPLKLDLHPELVDAYFGNYQRLNYLSQVSD